VIAPKDQLAGLLGEVGETGAFSSRRTARPDDLRLDVREVGPIAFSVPVRQAKQLCLVGRPARFGHGEQTLLDRGVRDTEVGPTRFATCQFLGMCWSGRWYRLVCGGVPGASLQDRLPDFSQPMIIARL
jgi:hypothetical protein